jgi:hypothetical protein
LCRKGEDAWGLLPAHRATPQSLLRKRNGITLPAPLEGQSPKPEQYEAGSSRLGNGL